MIGPQRRSVLRAAAVVALFAALTAIMTWPQARHLASQAPPHQDVYFNMWRLRWIAHALVTPRVHLFDANIFYPEPRTLALSDAMLVEGAAGAPLLWSGMPPVLVHNLLLLAAIALSGAAMFALVRYLTGSRGAAVLAGIVFAFAPYRFEHIMHMELQWTMWMPLAFLALHRTLETGRWTHGLATGVCVALQMLSSIYYGIFLATLLPLAALLLLPRDTAAPRAKALTALAAGGILALVVSAAYSRPYLQVRDRVGARPEGEIAEFSARPSSYLAATPGNWLYGGRRAERAGQERRLFPGALVALLAVVGLLFRPPPVRAMVYLLLMVAAFEISLGVNGYSFRLLQDHVGAYRALRASARLGIFVVMFVGILAAYGYQALAAGRSVAARAALAAALGCGLLLEYRVSLRLADYTNTPPPIYRLLATLPRGPLAELPCPRLDALPGRDPEYAYLSTFHWFPLVNGYSGVYPASYLARIEGLRTFPDDRSIDRLRRDGVRYVIVHASAYEPEVRSSLEHRLDRPEMIELGRFQDGSGTALLYRMR
jgi:hypothetical protein